MVYITNLDVESPSVYLWVTYFLAQLSDYYRDTEKALEWINLAIEHSPTAVELYMTKARIYKHAGNFNLAMESMDFARSLDLQDRFVNSKCTKYKLQNDKVADAEATIALFTRVSFFNFRTLPVLTQHKTWLICSVSGTLMQLDDPIRDRDVMGWR